MEGADMSLQANKLFANATDRGRKDLLPEKCLQATQGQKVDSAKIQIGIYRLGSAMATVVQ